MERYFYLWDIISYFVNTLNCTNIATITNVLAVKTSIVVVTHRNPDADAIGSALGLANYLTNMGHDVVALVPDQPPSYLTWMPGVEKLIVFNTHKEKAIDHINKAQVMFCVDFNNLSRIRDMREYIEQSQAFKILIDHHPQPATFTNILISEVGISSTAELLFEVFNMLDGNKHLDTNVAECLMAGIMGDTGCFSFSSSKPRTFNIVASLLEVGINKDKIYYNIYDNYSAERMKFMGYALNEKMVVLPEFRTAYIYLTRAEQDHYKHQAGDTEGFVNLPLSIKGICFTALFIERADEVKLSFRSKGNFSTTIFAQQHFNGGGHFNASGGETQEPLDEARRRFEELLPQYKDQLLKA